ncbi:ribonuclease H2, subunit B [Massariosphaeria phaeospora]|uniref:Ribonuclease H2 subunit B n=1 Tax=Massariosphaeria phaeospora TaxID=100035 RepID=A0A7C8MF62_9PLEO|nr:ribonuclease H2, subunit B [Massariosphaeria phaeospora]
MAKTRSKPNAAAEPKASKPDSDPSTKKTIPSSDLNPPKLFVLPKDASQSARIVTLDSPANGTPSKYLFCPEKGFYEFTRIAAPKKASRSWLITSEKGVGDEEEKPATQSNDAGQIGSGYITKTSDLFVATSLDMLFLILPILAPKSVKDTKQHFLSLDDHLDNLISLSPHWKPLLWQTSSLKRRIEKRLASICDTVDAGDETMYRLSHTKLLGVLHKKAERMTKNGLPASMEDKFVKPALNIPIMNIKRETSTLSVTSTPESQDSATTVTESQTTSATTATSFTSDPELPPTTLTTPPTIPPLLRLRTALNYLLTAYIPPTLRQPLQTLLTSPQPHSTLHDFTPLTAHLTALATLRSEATALRSISDNISRKRGFADDDEAAAEREEKKQKKEDEERRKKTESRGVKQLKKVNTSGMMKLSAFFTKAPVKKKA